MISTAEPSPALRVTADAIPERNRVEVIREVYGRTVLKVDLNPLGPAPVRFDMQARMLPGLGIATGSCSEMSAHHASRLIESDDLILLVALEGTSLMRHRGREEPVGNGQALMMTGDEVGLNMMRPGGIRFINMSFARKHFSPLIGDPGEALMRPLPTASGPMRLLIDYVHALQRTDEAMTPELLTLASSHIFDLAALAMGATRDAAEIARGRGVRVARLRAIKADIAAHDELVDMSAEQIAVRHGISARYMRKLFETEGVSLSEFMLGQRLSRAHRMLGDPRRTGQSITAIAYEAGFNDLSYFNRTFRRRYEATPSDVRARASASAGRQ